MDMVWETYWETAMTGNTTQRVSLYLCLINKICVFSILMKAHDKGNSREVLIIIQFRL